jgi:hypothetical protein
MDSLDERTGNHLCIICLEEVTVDEYFRNDFICRTCNQRDAYPLASTPTAEERGAA